MKVLVTGSGGLIGSEACRFFLEKGAEVLGIDNNMRKYFFGEKGDTSMNLVALNKFNKFTNYYFDLRERERLLAFMEEEGPFDLIIHAAAQPAHDWAVKEPFTDFDVNAVATFNMLEAFRLHSSKGVFVYTSTSKVYGDNPNKANLVEMEKRYDYAAGQDLIGVTSEGIDERFSIDQCTHSLFGASKAAADIACQEYGRYFNLNIGIFRPGCLTGPQHSAVELHGFLNYIIECAVQSKPYTIFGYGGKQVRDQIHSYDVVNALYHFYKNPKHGEVYNLGPGKNNTISILEVIDILKEEHGIQLNYAYEDKNRMGDHICFYCNPNKFMKDYPSWKVTKGLKEMIAEIVEAKK